VVLSTTLAKQNLDKTRIIRENIQDQIIAIKNEPGKNILIFGSPAASQTLMQLGLIDNYWIFMNPVLFGEGIPLFARLPAKTKLRLLSTRQFSNGELAIHYQAEKRMPDNVKSFYI
jgi:dihydrofolate reductase